MMKQNAPGHVVQYCYKDNNDAFFSYLCKHYEEENSFVYKLKCTCTCDKFIVYQDEHPSVFAECNNCGKKITVYDLAYYPAAVKLEKNLLLKKTTRKAVYVYVNYEYDDEFLYENDVDFNANDITWAKVFIANDNGLKKILDDETA
ncbi:MAG: hypothetical protein J6J42_10760 [Lachnospiraceae bacterium]|nr:hypothetical protein [Lachnospiraceae bacterium]